MLRRLTDVVLAAICCLFLLPSTNFWVNALQGEPQIVLKNDEWIQQRIEAFMEANEVPALSLAVTKNDRLVYAHAFGFANSSSHELATTNSRFRVASVSKTITAIAIMSLYEQGHFNLSSPVLGTDAILGYDYGSKPYSDAERAITVQDLLEHSSGFDDGVMGGDPTYQQQWLSQNQHELVGTILDAFDPSAWPGTNASYSNFGYMILGRIVEKFTDTSYATFVQDYLLRPLGIRKMDIGHDQPQAKEVAYYDTNITAPYTFHISRRDSVGAWIARPVDLVALLTVINEYSGRDDILQESTEKLFYEKSKVANSTYAKGWDDVYFDEDDGSLVEAEKNGGFPGTTAWVSVRANESVTYAVAINKAAEPATSLKDMVDSIMVSVEDWPDIDLFPDYGIKQASI